MSFAKFAVPVAALLAAVSAASDSCSFAATTISAAGDVSALGECSTISGNLVFATGAAAPTLALPSVEEIDGDFTYENDDTVTSFQAPMLKKISGKLTFDKLSNLHDIGMMVIETTGDLSITNCASLAEITTGTQYTEAGAIMLSNTYLNTMGGLGNLTKVESLSISGNPLLGNITMNINSVKAIDIGSNEEANQGLAVQFDNLTMAMDHITVQNATNVSFASLQTVVNNFELIFNNFESFEAPKLTNAGGFVLNSNPNLNNVSLPALVSLNGTNGTFQIANNSALEHVGGYPLLTDCEHDVIFIGPFKDAEVNNFQHIAGAMYVKSTEDINSTCTAVSGLKKTQVIRGKNTCSGQDLSANGSTSTKGGASSSTSSDAAIPIHIPALPTISAGLGVALLQFLLSF